MKSAADRRKRERNYTLAETREALLEAYYANDGDMTDYQRIGRTHRVVSPGG